MSDKNTETTRQTEECNVLNSAELILVETKWSTASSSRIRYYFRPTVSMVRTGCGVQKQLYRFPIFMVFFKFKDIDFSGSRPVQNNWFSIMAHFQTWSIQGHFLSRHKSNKNKQTNKKLYFILLVLRDVSLAEISSTLQTNTECKP